MPNCSHCGRNLSQEPPGGCGCQPVAGEEPEPHAGSSVELVPFGAQSIAPFVGAGYKFASRRAEERLLHPLSSALRSLDIRPKGTRTVNEFMEQRLQDLRSHRKSKFFRAYCFAFSGMTTIMVVVFCTFPFLLAWITNCVILVPWTLIGLTVVREATRSRRPFRPWAEQEFWSYWRLNRYSRSAVPKQVRITAEDLQTHLPTVQLSVYSLYEDAFLCARHRGGLGQEEECFVLEHWGSEDFRG